MKHSERRSRPHAVRDVKNQVAVAHKKRILVADDDYEMCRLIAATLRKAGYSVTMCASGINLLDHLSSYLLRDKGEKYELIVTDIRMPGVTGMEVLEGLRLVEGAPPIILITAFGDEYTHDRAAKLGAVTLLDKPFEMGSLLKAVQKTLAN